MYKKKNALQARTMQRMESYPAPAKNNNPYIPDVPGLVGFNVSLDRYKATAVFDDVLTPISADVGDIVDNLFTNPGQVHADILAPGSASHSHTIADDEGVDDLFTNSGQARLGIFLTTSAFRTETFEEQTGRKARACITQEEAIVDAHDKNEAVNRPLYPFNDMADWDLALWFQSIGCTKGDVDSFFSSGVLRHYGIGVDNVEPYLGLSFKNGEQWLEQLNWIPAGICGDSWRELELTVETEVKGQESSTVGVKYRNVIKSIKFLLRHPPFASDLVYGPTRQYNNKNKRVYTKMHTGDWWWKTQERLSDGSTIVPLLIDTDKTVLTQHHGNVAARPVYLTIRNLKAEVRRQQTRPSSLLLGFIPVGASGGYKAKIWHKALAAMLEREYMIFVELSNDPC